MASEATISACRRLSEAICRKIARVSSSRAFCARCMQEVTAPCSAATRSRSCRRTARSTEGALPAADAPGPSNSSEISAAAWRTVRVPGSDPRGTSESAAAARWAMAVTSGRPPISVIERSLRRPRTYWETADGARPNSSAARRVGTPRCSTSSRAISAWATETHRAPDGRVRAMELGGRPWISVLRVNGVCPESRTDTINTHSQVAKSAGSPNERLPDVPCAGERHGPLDLPLPPRDPREGDAEPDRGLPQRRGDRDPGLPARGHLRGRGPAARRPPGVPHDPRPGSPLPGRGGRRLRPPLPHRPAPADPRAGQDGGGDAGPRDERQPAGADHRPRDRAPEPHRGPRLRGRVDRGGPRPPGGDLRRLLPAERHRRVPDRLPVPRGPEVQPGVRRGPVPGGRGPHDPRGSDRLLLHEHHPRPPVLLDGDRRHPVRHRPDAQGRVPAGGDAGRELPEEPPRLLRAPDGVRGRVPGQRLLGAPERAGSAPGRPGPMRLSGFEPE